MARPPTTGLNVPRVQDAGLQRFFEAVIQRLNYLQVRMDGGAAAAQTGIGAGGAPQPVEPISGAGLPVLEVPGAPVGVEAFGGVGVIMVTWANPFRIYANHALAKVYRNTVDEFDTAAEIGQAAWLIYVDRQVMAETTYYYWVTFEATNGNEGPPSLPAMAMAVESPTIVYENFRDEILRDPLTADLRAEIELPQTIAQEISRIAAIRALIIAEITSLNRQATDEASATAGAALTQAGSIDLRVTRVVADIVALGETVSLINDELPNLARASALQATDARVQQNETTIGAHAGLLGQLRVDVDDKAAVSAIDALITRVETSEGMIEANAAELTALEASIGGRALGPEQNMFTGDSRAAAEAARDLYEGANPAWLAMYDADNDINIELRWGVLYIYQRRVGGAWVDNGEPLALASAVTQLNATVLQQGDRIAVNVEEISRLDGSIAGKADASAVDGLRANVEDNSQGVLANAAAITSLQASAGATTLGPEENTFIGVDRAAAEAGRDQYEMANPDWLAVYDRDPSKHIQLDWD